MYLNIHLLLHIRNEQFRTYKYIHFN